VLGAKRLFTEVACAPGGAAPSRATRSLRSGSMLGAGDSGP